MWEALTILLLFGSLSLASPVASTTRIARAGPATAATTSFVGNGPLYVRSAIVSTPHDTALDSAFVYGSFDSVPTSTSFFQTTLFYTSYLGNTPSIASTWVGSWPHTLYSTPATARPTMYFYARTDCQAATNPDNGVIIADSVASVAFDWNPGTGCTSSYPVPTPPSAIPVGSSARTWGSIYIPNNYSATHLGMKDPNGYSGGRGIQCGLSFTNNQPGDAAQCGIVGALRSGSFVTLRDGPQDVSELQFKTQIQTHPPYHSYYGGHGPALTPSQVDLFEYWSDSCFTFDDAMGRYLNEGTSFNCKSN